MRRRRNILRSEAGDDDEDDAEQIFFQDYLSYVDQKVADMLRQRDVNEMMDDYNKWQLSDWQMSCGSRYRIQRNRFSSTEPSKSSPAAWRKYQRRIAAQTTSNSALCIVPPEESQAWDSLQRFRFLCKDSRLYYFPPCITLFHPFAPPKGLASAAAATANLLQLMPSSTVSCFQLKLDRLVILVKAKNVLLDEEMEVEDDTKWDKNLDDIKQEYIDNLIRSEEIRGKVRRKNRLTKEMEMCIEAGKEVPEEILEELGELLSAEENDWEDAGDEDEEDEIAETTNAGKDDELAIDQEKLRRSPCKLCLALDVESAEKVRTLRKVFADEMFGCYDKEESAENNVLGLSLDLDIDSNIPQDIKNGIVSHEPLVKLGSFQSVSQALQMARLIEDDLKSTPLTFEVDDLHFISNGEEKRKKEDKNPDHAVQTAVNIPFGVDAKVTLVNLLEEEDLALEDDESYDELDFDGIFQSLLGVAEAEAKKALAIWSREEQIILDELGEELDPFSLLDETVEDWNEGAAITIGRTQFFLGEKREYHGMPAVNPMDRKDMAKGQTFKSGATRRKGARHGALRWNDGDYGSKASDDR
eukprot:CAMPEP_0196807260 /NCGR_PEP_ID=MMETSP1362-20130617/7221_1 /TAXON_ID=163516 /ORGANISM="Leptocylindrus danicus, Strain CCMP1856" /LENGTH=583 /DNA_ID=CAMNT_0042181101 /DNA_START=229 /DNA_END=1980 /DNA_ORIENTATION=+